jgi:hypothetical protein
VSISFLTPAFHIEGLIIMSKVKFADFVRANVTDTMAKPLSDELKAASEKAILSPIAASKDVRYAPHFRRAIQIAARCNFEINPESTTKVSLFQLDKAMKEAGVSIDERFECKVALAQAGLL